MRQLRSQAGSPSRGSSRDHRHRHSLRSDDRDSRGEKREGRDDGRHSYRRRRRSRSVSSDNRGEKRDDRKDRHRSYRRRRSHSTGSDDGHRSHRRRRSPDRDRTRQSRPRADSRERDSHRHGRSRKSFRNRSYSGSRNRSPHHSHRRRHQGRFSSRSRSPETIEKHRPTNSPGRGQHLSPDQASGAESDPLEDFVGPLPKEDAPVPSRGRGAYKQNPSNIDAHFAPDYDPSLDVAPEDDDLQTGSRSTRRPVAGLMTGDDDWELALEALRDRARWKQKGEDRLREAGFSNDIVERWKSTPTTSADDLGRLNSVKWSTKSDGREWDRGKFVDEDGHIDVKASW
ncbi:hypothetical protein BJX61DRAFT_500135 [Aspergillus egyptiacus]|nr:hypothetical protein BJX61DRAFT_500135 [Aspergillus egyptiacus]